jgi:Zn-dependent protease
MLSLLFSSPLEFIFQFAGIILAIGLHEAAHCFMADHLGDPTPRSQGRTTLNPLVHLDPLGTLTILLTGFFGWGKPSPYDPFNLKNPKRDTAIIALAGPASNLLLAFIASASFRFVPLELFSPLATFISLNIGLALFNLLPIPPLDGSKIVGLIMSHETAWRYQHLPSQHSYLLLLLFIMPIFGGVSLASLIISPIAYPLIRLLIPLA